MPEETKGLVLRHTGTNEERYFSQAELASAFDTGDWQGREGDTAYLVDDDGNPYQVDASRASQHIQFQGGGAEAQGAIDERSREAILERKYGSGVGNWFEAWNESLLQGASFGTYKAFAVKALGEDPEAISARDRFWRKTSLAGEISGAVIPFLLSGGLGATARTGIGAADIIPAIGLPRLAIAGGEALGGGIGSRW